MIFTYNCIYTRQAPQIVEKRKKKQIFQVFKFSNNCLV